eukprot:2073268-Pleurochrysis_carterae.AAC.3
MLDVNAADAMEMFEAMNHAASSPPRAFAAQVRTRPSFGRDYTNPERFCSCRTRVLQLHSFADT